MIRIGLFDLVIGKSVQSIQITLVTFLRRTVGCGIHKFLVICFQCTVAVQSYGCTDRPVDFISPIPSILLLLFIPSLIIPLSNTFHIIIDIRSRIMCKQHALTGLNICAYGLLLPYPICYLVKLYPYIHVITVIY